MLRMYIAGNIFSSYFLPAVLTKVSKLSRGACMVHYFA